MEGGAVGHKDHPSQIYSNLVQRFQRRNRYKSVERKISQKNPEYMLIFSLSCSCSQKKKKKKKKCPNNKKKIEISLLTKSGPQEGIYK
jgi:hypothetical protein